MPLRQLNVAKKLAVVILLPLQELRAYEQRIFVQEASAPVDHAYRILGTCWRADDLRLPLLFTHIHAHPSLSRSTSTAA